MYDDILGPAKTIKGRPSVANRPNLVRLTEVEIKDLQEDDDREYYVKLIRLYDPKSVTKWKGKTRLYVQRNKKDRLAVLTPMPKDIPLSWAEYYYDDITKDGNCVCEDYLMKIWKEI